MPRAFLAYPYLMICEEGLSVAHIAERCISAPLGGLRRQPGIDNVAKLMLTIARTAQSKPRAFINRFRKGLYYA